MRIVNRKQTTQTSPVAGTPSAPANALTVTPADAVTAPEPVKNDILETERLEKAVPIDAINLSTPVERVADGAASPLPQGTFWGAGVLVTVETGRVTFEEQLSRPPEATLLRARLHTVQLPAGTLVLWVGPENATELGSAVIEPDSRAADESIDGSANASADAEGAAPSAADA